MYANEEDETYFSGFCHDLKDLIHKYILDILGRAALQKRIMALLRKIDQHTSGNSQVKYFCRHFLDYIHGFGLYHVILLFILFLFFNCCCLIPLFHLKQAWDDTFRNWEVITQYLENYPKDAKVKTDSEIPTGLGETIKKRKPPHHANTEHELEVCP